MTNEKNIDEMAGAQEGIERGEHVEPGTTVPAENTPDHDAAPMKEAVQQRYTADGHGIYDAVDDIDEHRARLLETALRAVGVKSDVHWDRSPWGVRIGLVAGEYSDPTYEQPSLFVLIEGRKNVAGQWAWEWDLCLGNFGKYGNGRFEDLIGHILERTWLGEDVNKSARIIKDYVFLLTMGARIAHSQQLIDDQEGEPS